MTQSKLPRPSEHLADVVPLRSSVVAGRTIPAPVVAITPTPLQAAQCALFEVLDGARDNLDPRAYLCFLDVALRRVAREAARAGAEGDR